MQISRVHFFAFVEGVNIDGYVHGENCDRAFRDTDIEYRVSPANELPGEGGGKTRLKAYFEHLRDTSGLVTSLAGKVTIVSFFMDKDIDDRLGRKISSDHVFYTDFYDVENHVFAEGDVARAVSAGCSLAPNWCRSEFGPPGVWQGRIASLWREWVKLCYSAKLLKLGNGANYGRPSPINPSLHLEADADLAQAHRDGIDSSIISLPDWQAAVAEVDALYAAGDWDKVFKGKWYSLILKSQVIANCPNRVDEKHLAPLLVKQVAATMTFESSWAKSMQDRIRGLALQSGISAGAR
ncbi:hypothetical protein ACFY8Q_23495 [[Kitasatospora] papulosa]|uniref:hypothetical protein n=1 Tax=[Kitasatospora] papulosa TaxID=1464011 RepID=UPI0036CFF909